MLKKTVNAKAFTLLALGIAVTGVLLTLLLYCLSKDEVAAVNQYKVTAEEISFHMNRLGAQVQNEFQHKHQVSLGKEDWTKEFAGQIPLKELQQKALEESIQNKIIFMIAKEQHLVSYVDFSALSKEMKRENQTREAAIASGEIVYGLQRFTLESYYSHVLSALQTELKKTLSRSQGDPLFLERGDVENYFHEHKADWSAKATSYQVTRLTIPVTQDSKAAILEQVSQLVEQKASLQDIQQRYNGSEVSAEIVSPGENSANLNTYNNDLMTRMKGLQIGEISSALDTRQSVSVFRLDDIVFDESQALEEYGYAITQQMLDEKFLEYLDRYRESLQIQVNEKKLAAVPLPGS